MFSLLLASTVCAGGCARRAYNDVYVENMAAEIRDLEDQLYEFDGEYRLMEQQLDALKAENARLKSIQAAQPNNRLQRQELNSPSDRTGSDSFVPRGETKSPSASPNKTSPSPAPSLEIGPSSPTPATPPKPLVPNTPADGGAAVPGPTNLGSPSSGAPLLPPPKPAPGASNQFDPSDLVPPTIEKGEPMPPVAPPIKASPTNPLTMETDNDLELELGQIKLPAQLASLPISSQTDDSVIQRAQVHPPAEMPSDTNIVDIRFHPSLCRAVNTDQQGDDEGLYLVLQPYNAAGEFVPLPADLMVVALDLSRPENQATIGRWTLSAADVKAKMNPIGSSQGIHLSLSFSGPAPQCDRVVVFAYYTLANGRRVVSNQEVMLNNLHRQSAVWVPRGQNKNSPVRTASHEAPVKK